MMLFKLVGKFFKRVIRKFVKPAIIFIFARAIEILLLIPCFCICIISRDFKRDIDVGIGPEPLINNIHYKKAFIQAGFTAETFVSRTFFITDEFDLDLTQWRDNALLRRWIPFYLFFRSLFRYRALFIYFNGGAFFTKKSPFNSEFWRVLEPIFYKLANVKTIVVPYGGDVQVLTRSKNLYFKHAYTVDYPYFWKTHKRNRKNIDRWTRHASWVIAGSSNVDYLYHWNSLLISTLCIDTQRFVLIKEMRRLESDKLRILHAPNHPMIKGTDTLVETIELLKNEGLDIELIFLQGVSNNEIRKAIADVDLVADQFVIGWYGMFAVEAMAMEKPVLCYLRQDLIELYVKAGLITENGIPFINTNQNEIASKIRWAYDNREELIAIGKRGREYVEYHHSLEHFGKVLTGILNELGIKGR